LRPLRQVVNLASTAILALALVAFHRHLLLRLNLRIIAARSRRATPSRLSLVSHILLVRHHTLPENKARARHQDETREPLEAARASTNTPTA